MGRYVDAERHLIIYYSFFIIDALAHGKEISTSDH